MSLFPRECNLFCPNKSKLDRAYNKITELELILKASRKIILEEVSKQWELNTQSDTGLPKSIYEIVDAFDKWLYEQIE